MRSWLPALGLFLAALLVHVAVARPAQREAMRAQEEAARLRKERRVMGARQLRLDRERELGTRATRMDLPASAPSDEVTRLRLSLLEALAGQPVFGVSLSVGPGQPPLAALGRVRASGAFADLVRLSGRLVGPGRGFVLRRARFATSPAEGGLTLEIEGFSVSPGAP